ncbi:MAG: glycoside hydrolase family 99-like domain-containing protein [Spirochaetaceae bacterium]
MNKKYDVAAYVWPAYTGDEPRTRMFWPEGMGEWQSVKNSVKKFPEHNWPRKPLWGYVNEADPYVMESQISAAADHGVNVFIYDWYWYDKRPFLENCLNDGYLKAKNNDRVKFYLMWANHHVLNLWDINLSHDQETVIWDARVDRSEFERICNRLIDKYFHHPSYYTIEGKPVFSLYDIQNLIDGLGGVDETVRALKWFKEQTIKSGLPGLHLQLTKWGINQLNLSGLDEGKTAIPNELVNNLGFDSMTHYQYVHFTDIDRDYSEIMTDVEKEWSQVDKEYDTPFYPHVSIGWDNNPRFKDFKPGVVKNNTPQEIKKALIKAKEYLDAHPEQAPLVTINSWNEWTETSYLQPDDLYGYGYLEAVKDVFCK